MIILQAFSMRDGGEEGRPGATTHQPLPTPAPRIPQERGQELHLVKGATFPSYTMRALEWVPAGTGTAVQATNIPAGSLQKLLQQSALCWQ